MATDSFGDFTCYFRGPFFGRDATQAKDTSQWGNKDVLMACCPRLTQWVANNLEMLDWGQNHPAITEWSTKVIAQYGLHTLMHIWNDCSVGLPIDLPFEERNSKKDQWELFPDPDEAKQLNLVGMKGDVPVAVVSIDVNQGRMTSD